MDPTSLRHVPLVNHTVPANPTTNLPTVFESLGWKLMGQGHGERKDCHGQLGILGDLGGRCESFFVFLADLALAI